MKILAIESSCDECSASVFHDATLLSVRTTTQVVHQTYGGVVPELAGRSHLELIDKLVLEALNDAAFRVTDLDLIAATVGPGLVGSLLVGANYAKALALATGTRFRPIHHVEAHLFSAEINLRELPFPYLIFLASGGHTLLVRVNAVRDYHILGTTVDDALGEAYDKVGKLVGLSFPAGAEVDRLAQLGDAKDYSFPIMMADSSLNMSFSGLKTAVLYRVKSLPLTLTDETCKNLLACFQEAAIESVVRKIARAAEMTTPKVLVAAGGVAANSCLRKKMKVLAERMHIDCYFPEIRFCGDNAAMIGYLAWRLEQAGIHDDTDSVPRPRWPLDNLSCTVAAA